MTALRLPGLNCNLILGSATLAFIVLAAWPWLIPPLPAARQPATPRTGTPAPATPAALSPLASFAAIAERPLFSPSRRPPPGANTTAAAGPSIESRYQLLGILATGPKKKAFVAEGARRVEIVEGDTLDGWAVKQITQDRVLLNSPTGEAALKLKPAAPEPQKPQ